MIVHPAWWQVLSTVVTTLETAGINYTLTDRSALVVQGVNVPVDARIDVVIQWDLFQTAHTLFQVAEKPERNESQGRFVFERNGIKVYVHCFYNTVVVTDPDRLCVQYKERQFWVKSLDYAVRWLPPENPDVAAIKAHWRALQQENSSLNEQAWHTGAYEAWVQRFGSPQEAAQRIKKDPKARLASLSRYLGEVSGKRIINLLGSHGAKAIALALLGAEVTVADISAENARYAQDTAQAAGVQLEYVVADVLNLPAHVYTQGYDLVVMELGVLHYFVDLEPLASVIARLLHPGGRLVLQDFHPVSTKLITSTGKKHKVTGNYFDPSLITTPVAFSKHLPLEQQKETKLAYLRRWTLGEIVTAIAQAGLYIQYLEEEPNTKIDDIGLPKLFTLIAQKISLS